MDPYSQPKGWFLLKGGRVQHNVIGSDTLWRSVCRETGSASVAQWLPAPDKPRCKTCTRRVGTGL